MAVRPAPSAFQARVGDAFVTSTAMTASAADSATPDSIMCGFAGIDDLDGARSALITNDLRLSLSFGRNGHVGINRGIIYGVFANWAGLAGGTGDLAPCAGNSFPQKLHHS